MRINVLIEVINKLPDFERKILRILYNYLGQRKRIPTMDEFEVKTW